MGSRLVSRGTRLSAAGAALVAGCASDPPPPQIPLARLTGEGCVEYTGQPVDRVCLPRAARESTPLVLEVEERCGTCSTSIDRCGVTVEGREIFLSLDGKSCTTSARCEVCTKRRVACRLPALDAGRYTLRYADDAGRVDVLEVAAGGATKCALDDGA